MIQPQSLIQARYRVGRRLGDGGMAIVYFGHDLFLGRDVAIKTLRPQFAADPELRTRFEREARAAAALSHPNIIDVYDVGEDDGVPFIVMELVRGQTLKTIIAADAPFHPDDVAELLAQIGAALDYAHRRGYVHRDVKPGNILVDEHGRARVVDFGIAKSLADADLTEQGAGFGTAAYLSPEQAEGLMVTPASDVYSTGVVAYEMLTGALPFRAETPVGLAMRHVHDVPPPPSSRGPGITAQVDAAVMRALDKDPTRRWPSVLEFSQALRDWRDSPSQPDVQIVTDERSAYGPQRGSLAPTIAIVLLIVAALAALLWTGFRNLPQPEQEPETPPTVLIPPAAEITGERDREETGEDAIVPAIVPQDAPTIAPTEAAEIPAIPTIAPVTQGSVTVPNVLGLTISGATQALGPLGLRMVPSQPVFSETVPLNAIAAQDPTAGSIASPGDQIRVSLSRGPSPFPDGDEP